MSNQEHVYTEASILARYRALCADRDAAYELAKPAELALAAQSAIVIAEQAKEEALAREVEAAWGPDHLARKKEISLLAKLLGRPNGPLAAKG
jgi:hypothetical protein